MITSGSGPSSRMLPASRKSTPWRTHSYMMPRGEHAAFDRLADPAGAANAVDRAQVMFVARLGQVAAIEIDAQAGAEEGLLDVVRGQGVAGEEHVDIAHADELLEELAAAGVHDGRPADQQRLAARGAVCGQFAGRSARMATPLGFSVETVLPMNSNGLRVRATARSGKTRTPAWPTTNRVARRDVVIGTQRAGRRPGRRRSPQSIS